MRSIPRSSAVLLAGAALLAGSAMLLTRAALAGNPPADAPGRLEVTRAMTLPEFLGEIEKHLPGLFTWSRDDRLVARTTVPLGAYSLEREWLVRHLRGLLFPSELVLVATGEPPHETHRITDMRARLKPGETAMKPQPVVLDGSHLSEFADEDGLLITTRISAKGLTRLESVRRVLLVVMTPGNVGRVVVDPDAQALEVTDFAPNVVKAYLLVEALVARELAK